MMDNVYASLRLMIQGMVAIFVVILVIYAAVVIMQKLGSRQMEEEN